MTLETLLREAAPEATFDPADVRRRVDRTRGRRRLAVGAAAAVVLLAGALGAWALVRHDGPDEVVAGPPDRPGTVPLTEDALIGSRWVSIDPTDALLPWVEFAPDGSFNDARCSRGASGTWAIEGGTVALDESGIELGMGCDASHALHGTGVLSNDGTLQFTEAGIATLELRRVDDLAEPATHDDLVGGWQLPDGTRTVSFDDDVIHLGGGCDYPWSFQAGRIRSVQGSVICDFVSGPTTTVLMATLNGQPFVAGDDLYLLTDGASAHLVRAGSSPDIGDLAGYWLAEGTDGSLLTDFHLEVFRGDGTDQRIAFLPNRPSFRIFNGCDMGTGSLTETDAGIDVDITSWTSGYCSLSEQATLLPEVSSGATSAGSTSFTRDGDVLVAENGLRYRHLQSAAVDQMVGTWQAEHTAVTFEPNGSAVFGSCRFGQIRSTNGLTELVGRGTPCSGADGSVLERGEVLRAYLDDGVLFLAWPGDVQALTPLTLDDVSSSNAAEDLLLGAYGELGVEQCCAQLSEGGETAEVGFLFEGTQIPVIAVPNDGTVDLVGTEILDFGGVLTETDTGTAVLGVCNGFDITVHEDIAAGEISDDTLIDAARLLFGVLDCASD